MTGSPAPVRRTAVLLCLTLVAAGVLALSALALADAWTAVGDGSWQQTTFDELLVWWSALVASLVTGWMWLGACSLTLLADPARSDRPARAMGLPTWFQRLVLTACGAALASAATPATLASAAPAPPSVAASERVPAWADRVSQVLDGLPLPDRPDDGRPRDQAPEKSEPPPPPTPPTTPPTPTPPTPGMTTVTVAPGDTLWGLARAHLGAQATDADIAEHWRALWHVNADVVGPNPDLVLPGQRLVLPTTRS